MAGTTTRMNNRKAPDTVGRPHDDGHKADLAHKAPPQGHASPKDLTAAIDAAEQGAQPAAKTPNGD
jgi:hypothetical protein